MESHGSLASRSFHCAPNFRRCLGQTGDTSAACRKMARPRGVRRPRPRPPRQQRNHNTPPNTPNLPKGNLPERTRRLPCEGSGSVRTLPRNVTKVAPRLGRCSRIRVTVGNPSRAGTQARLPAQHKGQADELTKVTRTITGVTHAQAKAREPHFCPPIRARANR